MYKQQTLLLFSLVVGLTQAAESTAEPIDANAAALAAFAAVMDSAVARVETAHNIFETTLRDIRIKASAISSDAHNDIDRDTVFHALDQSLDDIGTASRTRYEVMRAAQEAIQDAQTVAEATVGSEAARIYRLKHSSRRDLDYYIIRSSYSESLAYKYVWRLIKEMASSVRGFLKDYDSNQAYRFDTTYLPD